MSDSPPGSAVTDSSAVPPTLRGAGVLGVLEGLIGLGIAIYLIAHSASNQDSYISGFGTGLWFIVMAGAVLAGGMALYQGRRWGRALIVLANILLVPVAWSMLFDSNQPMIGAPLMVAAVVTLGLVFAPRSMQYLAADQLPPDA